MNTKIEYLYTDASNYKAWNTFVAKGEITPEQIKVIRDALDPDDYFIPRQVGLEEERPGALNEDDHCWFQMAEETFEIVDAPATSEMTVGQLVENFRQAGEDGWDDATYAIVLDDFDDDSDWEDD